MKKLALAILPLALIVALALIGCGKTPGGGQTSTTAVPGTVGMNPTNFVIHTVTIKAGTAVHFDDTVGGGGTHIICLGKDQQCDTSAQGPQAVMGAGFTIQPGQTKDVVFPTAGTYQITCSVHQNMNLTVTVQ
ncbi:MAG: cupredoxin domain-containing protein [Ktedonobacterales bacterium]